MMSPKTLSFRMIVAMIALYILNELLGLVSLSLEQGRWFNAFYYLGFSPSNIRFGLHPWGIVTYPWVHISSYALLLNSLLLYQLGGLYQRLHYSSSFYLSTFVWGSLFGAICYALVAYVYAQLSFYTFTTSLYGASAGVCALAFTVGIRQARMKVAVAGLRINFLLLLLLVYAWSVLFVGENIGGMLAHLGGAIYGSLLGLREKREAKQDRPTEDNDIDDSERRAVLDKLRSSGYKSLTKDEQELL